MKDIIAILRRNFISPIVIAILLLASLLLVLNEPRDAWFISVVIIINTSIAIIQEIRAMLALKKLELLNAPKARRIRSDGVTEEVMFDKLIVGDMVSLKLGDEVPADGQITESAGLETDESILTGESASVDKPKGAVAYAASAVVAGSATMQVTSIGTNTRVGVMSSTLKRYVPQLTPLQKDIRRAILWLTYAAVIFSILILIVYSLTGHGAVQILRTITSSAIVLVPEGLLLASSLLLAFGSIRLAQAKVLPQKLDAIEAMGLLDVLCVDKTGTLTSDEITFEKFEIFDKSNPHLSDIVGITAAETNSGNATGNAIVSGFSIPGKYKVLQTLAFSSGRKMSGVKLNYKGNDYSVIIGAPEFVEVLAPLSAAQKKNINLLATEGKRVLLVAIFDDTTVSLKNIPKDSGRVVGLVVLANELRQGVAGTVAYLQKNGVSLRVISGDNPDTVKYVAKLAGISGCDNVLTGVELNNVSDKDWDKVVAETSIFARVLPEQKERLIATFKSFGKFTGMVGDGVNDALALKKSDLGVAMYSGAVATRRVADVVLLNNSFNSFPTGMRLGNRIMQTIEIISVLFFHKIIYGVILLVGTLSFGVVYPFEPRHITFMNIFLVTLPTIIWTLFIPYPGHRLSPRSFWKDTLLAVAPIAAISGIVMVICYNVLRIVHSNNLDGVYMTTVLIATFFGIFMVFLAPLMFDVRHNHKARLARLAYVIVALIIIVPSFSLDFARDFFDFSTPAWQDTWPLLVLIIGAAVLQWRIAIRAGRRVKRSRIL